MNNIHPDLLPLAVLIESLDPLPGNPRRGDVEAVARSYEMFGQRKPVVAQRQGDHGVVIAGNHQLAAARKLGWDRLAVIFVDDDDPTAHAFALADNHTSDLGGYDDELLAQMIQEVSDYDAKLLAATSYSDDDLARLLADLTTEFTPRTDPDAVPEPPNVPVTKRDDVWLCGEHRVMCADATKRSDVEKLLGGCAPDALLTDPPYGVSHGSGITPAKAIRGDIGQAVIPISFALAVEALSPDARLYVFGGSEQSPMYHGLWDHHLHAHPRVIVWVKESFVLRQVAYHSQFELVYWGWKGKGGGTKFWYGDRKTSDVWQVSRDRAADRVHSTQKPVDLLRIPLTSSVAPGGTCLDLFGGSGSTLIAAQQTDRVAYLMELDPSYVDVICRRFQDFTGEKPVLEATGEPHDFVSQLLGDGAGPSSALQFSGPTA